MRKNKLLLALLLTGSLGYAQIITTVAGTGTASFSGDGGQATAATLNEPIQDVAFDGSGNMYIADEFNYRVRKVNSSGVISTYAGNGSSGYTGNGGSATSAKIRANAVAIDGSGNLYILSEQCIRKVNTSGVISAFAGSGTSSGFSGDGGQATAALIDANTASGGSDAIAVDGSGNVYFTDLMNKRIRKINTSGVISTVAGNGTAGYTGDGGQATAAKISYTSGLTIDASGNLYISDQTTVVRKVNTSGVISTFAGNGTSGYSGDGGQATAAKLNHPSGLCVDGAGNLYIADYTNWRIRKVNSSGVISTFAGNGSIGSSGDGGQATAASLGGASGVKFDATGALYITDEGNYKIRKVGLALCTADAGPNVIDQQDFCGNWGVTIGTAAITGLNYSWAPTGTVYISGSSTIAQPTAVYSNTVSPYTYTVTVTSQYDPPLCALNTSTVQVTAKNRTCLNCCFMAGISEPNAPQSIFNIFPNPANTDITVVLSGKTEYLKITDVLGKVVLDMRAISDNEIKIDVSQFRKGVYFVTTKIEDKIEQKKLLVE